MLCSCIFLSHFKQLYVVALYYHNFLCMFHVILYYFVLFHLSMKGFLFYFFVKLPAYLKTWILFMLFGNFFGFVYKFFFYKPSPIVEITLWLFDY